MRYAPFTVFSLLAVVALSGVSGGCATQRVAMNEGVREYVASDYPSVLKRWTREEHLIELSELDDMLTVTATYESWDFRWAYVIRYADDYRLTVEQRRQLLDKTLAETRSVHTFYVALYGTKWRWVDLSKPGSSWVVRLIDEKGNETAPSALEAIVKPGAIEYRYFPYTTPFRHVFRVNFPVARADGKPAVDPGSKWFGLRFAGAEGHEELHWDIEQPEEKKAAFGVSPEGGSRSALRARSFDCLHPAEDLE